MNTRRWGVVFRTGWLLLAALLYAYSIYVYRLTGHSDAEVLLIYGMLVLSFPISWAVTAGAVLVITALQSATGELVQTSYLGMTAFWFAQCIGGYLQWFVLLPWFLRREERSKVSRT